MAFSAAEPGSIATGASSAARGAEATATKDPPARVGEIDRAVSAPENCLGEVATGAMLRAEGNVG
eukprot:CAMPEP_0169181722 /NCGR_PEP_ID=MMETSP1015-20121227/68843_1 /TAXON_ID=342587 /ORGANISM="Karlodinium micrum, Strain CCMP2283" /LENGTH=64 /DNA_ID=CAMNT_0009256891 /DNA_START=195 /DNA_END=389 /DNA_ORIENTATION=-